MTISDHKSKRVNYAMTTMKQAAKVSSKASTKIPQTKIEELAAVLPVAAPQQQQHNKNLFIQVETFNSEGRTVGHRIVDLYHFGTRNWLQNHHWWAMHNDHTVETKTAGEAEVSAYLAEQKLALANKFNGHLNVGAC